MDDSSSSYRLKTLERVSKVFSVFAIAFILNAPWTLYVAIVNFHNREIPRSDLLETLHFKILQANTSAPNFRVEFGDGTRSYISFPNFLWLESKVGLRLETMSDFDRERLEGCQANAKVNNVPWYIFGHKQIWDLECSSKNIHYGPTVIGGGIGRSPLGDLLTGIFATAGSLVIATLSYLIRRTLKT